MDVVATDAEAIYGTNGRHHRLVIHELCKMATSPLSVRQSKDELSDDEPDEDDDAIAEDAPLHAMADHDHDNSEGENEQETTGQQEDEDRCVSNTPELETCNSHGDACQGCEREESLRICELAQFMIDTSHSLGPMRVVLPENEEDEQGGHQHYGEIAEDVLVGERGERYRCHESILTVPDSSGKTPLHILCECSCDMNMLKVIFGSTRESSGNPCAPTAFSLITAKDSRGSTPLHYLAYSRQCPFSSLQLMMDFCKPIRSKDRDGVVQDPTLMVDSDGDTPLHWALDGYMSPRRIQELTRHSKGAIMVLNQAGKRPFDQFSENFIDADWKIHDVCGREVWQNIQAYLRVVCDAPSEESDDDCKLTEWLPLHLIAGSPYELPPIFTDLAIHFCKEDLSKINAQGMLPLHLACQRRSINVGTLCNGSNAQKILAEYPQAAYTSVTTTKRLAFHLAVATQKPMSLITGLIKAYPRSLNIPDPVTGLWPFVLAGVGNEISVAVSFTLLRADPSILQLAMKDDMKEKKMSEQEALMLMAEAELEDQSSRRIRRIRILDPHM